MTAAHILHAVAAAYQITPERVRVPYQGNPDVDARHVAVWLLRDMLGWSYTQIGRALGGRHHTTALASYRVIEVEREFPVMQALLDGLRARYSRVAHRCRRGRICRGTCGCRERRREGRNGMKVLGII